MSTSAMIELGERLAAAWASGEPLPSLPRDQMPQSTEEAYAAQGALIARLVPRLGPIVGWKVGAASPTAEPNAAPLLADLVQRGPARFGGRRLRLRGIEAELAFRIARSLPARREPYGETEVAAAIQSIHPAIELVETRFADWQATPPFAKLADTQSNGGFCFGRGQTDWRTLDLVQQKVTLEIDGKRVAEAQGGNAAGHPLRLLVWLANHAGRLGRGLAAGDIITTGSHTGLVFAHAGARVAARVATIGEVNLDLSET